MNGDTAKRRILSLDGGGIKGTFAAAFLARIEETTGKRIVDHFDLIVGTSTGGIIALGLGLGMSAVEILELYETEGPSIFPNATRSERGLWNLVPRRIRRAATVKYDPAPLRRALEKCFGARRLGESAVRLAIPAYHPDRRTPHVFKTSHHERFDIDWRTSVVDVAMSTTAAPTYFPAHATSTGELLVDGGVWANNPTGLAVVEAIGVLSWPCESLYVLSIGCTDSAYTIPHESTEFGLALTVAEVFTQGQSQASLGTAKLLTGHSDQAKKLFRYSPAVPHGTFTLDDITRIARLKSLGLAEARVAIAEIETVFLYSPVERFVPFHGR